MPATGGNPALPWSVHRAFLAGILKISRGGEHLKPLVGESKKGAGHVAGRGGHDDFFPFLVPLHCRFGFVGGAFGFRDEVDFFGVEAKKLGQFVESFCFS